MRFSRRLAASALGVAAVVALAGCARSSSSATEARETAKSSLVEGQLEVAGLTDTEFGTSLGISGALALVGSPGAPVDGVATGAVYAFTRKGSHWVSDGVLSPDSPTDGLRFGTALSVDGNLAAVASGTFGPSESVSLFSHGKEGWGTADKVLESPLIGDAVGFGAPIVVNGTTIFVGAPAANGSAGQVFAYERTAEGWGAPQTLPLAADSVAGAFYGSAISVLGNRALIAAPEEPTGGAVYVLERPASPDDGARDWAVAQRIPAPDGVASFGIFVGQTSELVAISAPQDGAGGAVYTYVSVEGKWQPDKTLRLNSPGPNDYFGFAFGFSATSLFVASPGATDDSGHGRVQEYRLDASWSDGVTVYPSRDSATDFFGQTLAVSRNATVLVADLPFAYAFLPGLAGVCEKDYECDSGHCAEGVCCEDACDSPCHSCLAQRKVDGGPDGLCGPVIAGDNPGGKCAVSDDECGTTGMCDGEGACALADAAISCGTVSCFAPTAAVGVGQCDGRGQCRMPKPTNCVAGYECRDGACVSECESSAVCDELSGYYCYAGKCVKGARCSDDGTGAVDAQGVEKSCPLAGCASRTEAVGAGYCEGKGECRVPESVPCAVGYACREGECASDCTSSDDCDDAEGYYCYLGECVQGAHCSEDRTVAIDVDGQATRCLSILCSDGACLTQCRDTTDCVEGLVCDLTERTCMTKVGLAEPCSRSADCVEGLVCDPYGHTCVSETSLAKRRAVSRGGCTLGPPAANAGSPWLGLVLVGLRVGLRLRRKKRSSREWN